MHPEHQPIPSRVILRVMVVLIVIVSLMAGYYKDRFEVWRMNNALILDKFDVQTTQELLKKNVEVK